MARIAENQLKERLRERLEASGKSMHAVSKAIGANPGYVRDLMDPAKNTAPTFDKLRAIAQELETTVDYLSGDSNDPEQVRSQVGIRQLEDGGYLKNVPANPTSNATGTVVEMEIGIPLVGTGDCADLEVCDQSGNLVQVERSSFDEDYHVRMIARPPALRGARDLYAVYFHGESMQPRFEPGEVGIVDPRRPAGPGDYVLVQLNTGDSDDVVSVLVKRLVRQNAQELVLEQFNPPLIFTVKKSRVSRVHRILQQTDLLFG